MLSVLQNIKKEDIRYDPFPHVIVKNALNKELYKTLSSNFPKVPVKASRRGSNIRVDLRSGDAKDIHRKWKEVMAYHTSPEFWAEFVDLFKDAILQCHPNIEKQYKRKLEYFRIKRDIEIDCSASMNTPVTGKPSSVRSTHVDNEFELYGALLYMRDENDDSTGGDLQIHRWNGSKRRYFSTREGHKSEVPRKMCSLVETVPYEANTMILFINSANSIHGVTPRSITNFVRRFMIIHGRSKKQLFNIKRYHAGERKTETTT